MKRLMGIVIVGLLATACGESAYRLPSAPSLLESSSEGSGGVSSTRQAGIQCSDAPVQWVTTNFSPIGRSARVNWVAVPAIGTYEVEVRHNRNGETPKFVYSFTTDLTEASIDDKEDGGRYYVRVRVYNACNTYGAWSETLIVYIDGSPDQGGRKPACPYTVGRCEPPPPDEDEDEDDGNNGHGNDDDGDDDSNPGGGNGGNGGNGGCDANEDDNNNGHGNDCDQDDDSNPGNS